MPRARQESENPTPQPIPGEENYQDPTVRTAYGNAFGQLHTALAKRFSFTGTTLSPDITDALNTTARLYAEARVKPYDFGVQGVELTEAERGQIAILIDVVPERTRHDVQQFIPIIEQAANDIIAIHNFDRTPRGKDEYSANLAGKVFGDTPSARALAIAKQTGVMLTRVGYDQQWLFGPLTIGLEHITDLSQFDTHEHDKATNRIIEEFMGKLFEPLPKMKDYPSTLTEVGEFRTSWSTYSVANRKLPFTGWRYTSKRYDDARHRWNWRHSSLSGSYDPHMPEPKPLYGGIMIAHTNPNVATREYVDRLKNYNQELKHSAEHPGEL